MPPERGVEMTMAGEAKLQAQSGQVVVLPEKIQRPGQAQPQLIAIQRKAFHLLEDLSQIYRGPAHFSSDFGQRPPTPEIARQQELRAIHQPPAADAGAGCGVVARP